MTQDTLLNGTDLVHRLTLLFSSKKAEVCGQVYLLYVIKQSALFTAFFGYPLRHTAERDSFHYGYYRIGYVREIDGN